MYNNSYNTYKQQSVMTMTSGEMLVKLYDEVIKQMNSAIHSIGSNDTVSANLSLQKCQKILNYLDNTLDRKYPISQQLSSLYDFFIRQIVDANVRKEAKALEETLPLVIELRDTFVQAEKLSRISSQQRPSAAAGGMLGAVSAVG